MNYGKTYVAEGSVKTRFATLAKSRRVSFLPLSWSIDLSAISAPFLITEPPKTLNSSITGANTFPDRVLNFRYVICHIGHS